MPQISTMSAAQYFGLLAEDAFPRAGVRYPEIAAYTAGMLTDFVRAERVYNPLWRTGRKAKADNLAEMIKEANSQSGFLRASVKRHIGDFTLFMSGIFPEYMEQRGVSPRFYASQGKSSYRAASNYHDSGFGSLLSAMADCFEKCVAGLNRIREEHFCIEQADYEMLIVPKDRDALNNLFLDAMNRWKETRNIHDRRIAVYYAERLGISADELLNG